MASAPSSQPDSLVRPRCAGQRGPIMRPEVPLACVCALRQYQVRASAGALLLLIRTYVLFLDNAVPASKGATLLRLAGPFSGLPQPALRPDQVPDTLVRCAEAPPPAQTVPHFSPGEYPPAPCSPHVPAPMLARLESALPRGPAWRYEPKLDGFRGLLWRSDTGVVRLLSRNLKDLSLSFPELVRAARSLAVQHGHRRRDRDRRRARQLRFWRAAGAPQRGPTRCAEDRRHQAGRAAHLRCSAQRRRRSDGQAAAVTAGRTRTSARGQPSVPAIDRPDRCCRGGRGLAQTAAEPRGCGRQALRRAVPVRAA